MDDDLGVGGGLEDRAGPIQLIAQQRGVYEIAVVRDRNGPCEYSTTKGWAFSDGLSGRVALWPMALDLPAA
jgi:hypothetical protein